MLSPPEDEANKLELSVIRKLPVVNKPKQNQFQESESFGDGAETPFVLRNV